MGRKITVDLSEKSWLVLMERQFEAKRKGLKSESLSKMVADMVDMKLEEEGNKVKN